MEVQVLSPEVIQDTVLRSASSPSGVTKIPGEEIDRMFSQSTNVTTTVLNAKVLSCSDEWFAEAANLLNPGPVKGYPGVFVSTGAKYDGWETRRHNPGEFDWVVIKLGCVASIAGVEVDTAFFTGNYGELAALDAVYSPGAATDQDTAIAAADFEGWELVLPPQKCGPSQRQAWALPDTTTSSSSKPFTHVRLRMYPDGGFARLRLYGSVVPPPPPPASAAATSRLEELSSALNGGVALACSDQHYGVRSNLILPGRGVDMGDGWETARSRGAGHVDWVIFRLGLAGKTIERVVVDTKDFKGNFPRAVRVEGIHNTTAKNDAESGAAADPRVDDPRWTPLLRGAEVPGRRHVETVYDATTTTDGGLDVPRLPDDHVWTHVKLTIVPDGGVKRLRIFGQRA